MSAWIISIVCVVSLGVLLDIILPEGEIHKYIRGIFSLVTVVVIISPLPKLINSDFDLFEFFGNQGEYQVDEDYLQNLQNSIHQNNLKNVQFLLEKNGYKNVEIDIEYDEKNMSKIKKIDANLKNLVLSEGAEHTDIIVNITNIIRGAFSLKEGQVNVYGY